MDRDDVLRDPAPSAQNSRKDLDVTAGERPAKRPETAAATRPSPPTPSTSPAATERRARRTSPTSPKKTRKNGSSKTASSERPRRRPRRPRNGQKRSETVTPTPPPSSPRRRASCGRWRQREPTFAPRRAAAAAARALRPVCSTRSKIFDVRRSTLSAAAELVAVDLDGVPAAMETGTATTEPRSSGTRSPRLTRRRPPTRPLAGARVAQLLLGRSLRLIEETSGKGRLCRPNSPARSNQIAIDFYRRDRLRTS